MAHKKMRQRRSEQNLDETDIETNMDTLLSMRFRSFASRDPYSESYQSFNPDHRKLTTGYEYPSLASDQEKNIWKRVVRSANCYAYAFGKPKGVHFPQPGHFGIPEMKKFHNLDREFTCSNYLSRLLLDNPIIYPVSHKKKCKDGFYKVYFTVAPNRDYHLYRQDNDGLYSHKPGSTPATSTDSSSHRIKDPQIADRFNPPEDIGYHSPTALYYNTVCNSFCVPNKSKHVLYVE
jgi:hypothetical protein